MSCEKLLSHAAATCQSTRLAKDSCIPLGRIEPVTSVESPKCRAYAGSRESSVANPTPLHPSIKTRQQEPPMFYTLVSESNCRLDRAASVAGF